MTPDWLCKHSTITKPFTVYSEYLEIFPGTTLEQLIQTELIAPNILTTTDSLAVTLTIAMDTVLADSADHDPAFGISDGSAFIGFVALDKGNYHDHSPCLHVEGDIANKILNRVHADTKGKVNSRLFPSEIKIQLKTTDQWGSCHTEHDEGHVKIVNYQRKLDLTKGLYFEMFRADSNEKYRIEYVVINIELD